jgi:hypothetical protein
MSSLFFHKETIEIYGYASTDDFNENKIYVLKCKYAIWTDFLKHLLYAFHNYLYKIIQNNFEQCEYYEYKCIQDLYEYNLTETCSDDYTYFYLNKNIDIYRTALIHYNLYGIYCFYQVIDNLDNLSLINNPISIGNMYDICSSFDKMIDFISDVKSLQCLITIQQIFKNYISINKYTVISITYNKLTLYNDSDENIVFII